MKSFFGSFERMIRFKNTPEAICGEGAVLRVSRRYVRTTPRTLGRHPKVTAQGDSLHA